MNLPPLAAIRAFEAAARLLSFTRAAEELAMTQAAVSYQIKVLEERVGQPLFVRRARQVELTETGQALSSGASEALRILAESYEQARTGGQGTLSISTVPTFAAARSSSAVRQPREVSLPRRVTRRGGSVSGRPSRWRGRNGFVQTS